MADTTLPRSQAEEARIISERLVVMLHRTGIGQRELAGRLGWGKNSISEVKGGRRHLTLTQLRHLAAELGTSAEYLLGLTDDSSPGNDGGNSGGTIGGAIPGELRNPNEGLLTAA